MNARKTQTKFVERYFGGLREVLEGLDLERVAELIEMLREARAGEKKVFFMGNGGSAAAASHLAADLGKNTVRKDGGGKRFKVWALTDSVEWMTAVGNDMAYEDIFVEQLKNLAEAGDVVVAISGSGNSPNIVKALRWAKTARLKTTGLLGFDGGKAKRLVEVAVVVGVKHYGYVEGVHAEIHHCIVEALKL